MGITHGWTSAEAPDGSDVTPTNFNDHTGNPSYVGCLANKSGNQAITFGVTTTLTFTGTDSWDTDGFHDPASNDSRITIPTGKGGLYLVSSYVQFAQNSTNDRGIHFGVTGTSNSASQLYVRAAANWKTRLTLTVPLLLAAGDYVEVLVDQDSGTTINVEAAWFSVVLLGT